MKQLRDTWLAWLILASLVATVIVAAVGSPTAAAVLFSIEGIALVVGLAIAP